MQADDEKMFLENIEEYVMDEGKLVTYKWLSATLDLHVNTAKQLLYKYAMPENKRKDGVHMTYLVAGALTDGSGMKIQIVRENDLDYVKSKFKLITSEHIYSVQKANHLPDLNILYGVDNLKNEKNNEDRFGAIRCTRAVRRLGNDIKSLQIKARAATAVVNNPMPSSKKGSSVSTSSSLDKVRSEPVAVALPTNGPKISKPEPTKPVESKSSTGNSIASLFTAQTKAGKNNNDKSVSVVSNNKPAAKKGKGGGGIAMFFTKQSEKQAINTELKRTLPGSKPSAKENDSEKTTLLATETPIFVDKKEPSPTKDDIKMDVDKEEKTNPKSDIVKEKKGKNSQKVISNDKQTNLSGKGKKKMSTENSQPVKKRKRIMVISDDSASSGEDIFGNDSDDEIRPPSPELLPEEPSKCHSSDEDVIPSTPMSQQIRNGKVRKRKLVDKTFEDKDGFIMTKKEYVFESCSEDDADNDKQVCTNLIGLVVQNSKTNVETKNDTEEVEMDKSSNKHAKGEKQARKKKTLPSSGERKDDTEEVEMDKPSKKQAKGEKQTRKKKALPPVGQKSKQSTLMSFFNKN